MQPSDKQMASALNARSGKKLPESFRHRLRTLPWLYIASFMLLALLIGGFIWHDLGVAYDDTLAYWNVFLSQSGEDRVRIISLWLSERRTDAEVIAENPFTARLLAAGGGKGSVTEARNLMAEKLQGIEPGRGYLAGFIVDKACNILTRGGSSEVTVADLQPTCNWIYRTRKFGVIGSHLDRESVWVNLGMPVFVKEGSPGSGPGTRRAVGAVILVFEPWKYMSPLIASEAAPTRTTETLLIGSAAGRVFVFSPRRVILREASLFR